ncbi:MAG: DUF6340 family protein [Bacteroidales bacterium]|nr:DUF6340 family protein [Bacteroidales bacterium]
MKNFIFISFIALLFSACSSLNFTPVYINVNKPANNLILSIKDSMVFVDNAVLVPDSLFAEAFLPNNTTKTVIFDLPPVKEIMLNSLSQEMYKSNMFADISVFTVPQRQDKEWDKPLRLTPLQMDTIFEQSGAKWILSLDCLKFKCNFIEKIPNNQSFVFLEMQTIVQPVFRLYKKGSYNELKQYYISDTLNIVSNGISFSNAISLLDCTNTLADAIQSTAEKAYHRWLPYSEEQGRVIGKNSNINLKEAYYYFIDNKLKEAYYMWEHVYENSINKQDKMVAAFNNAVCMETMNNPQDALNWLEKSFVIYKELGQDCKIDFLGYRKILQQQIKEKPYVDEQLKILEKN